MSVLINSEGSYGIHNYQLALELFAAANAALDELPPPATATPTATPVPPTPTATPTPTVTPTPTATPTPAPVTIRVPAARADTGYVDSRATLSSFFGNADIWAGMDNRPQTPRVLYGVTQFNLMNRLPADARILSVEVEFTGRSTRYLNPAASGVWTLNLLDASVDAPWAQPGFGYWHVANARVVASIEPTLGLADLGAGQVNTFRFSAAQLGLVQQKLASTGKLSFRLDGVTTTAYARQIFSWSGWAPPVLRITYVPGS